MREVRGEGLDLRACGVGVAGQNMEQYWQSPQNTPPLSFSSLPSVFSKARAIFHFPPSPLSIPFFFGPADSSVRIFSAYAQSRRFALKANVRFWYAWNQSFFSSSAKYWASNNFIRYVHYIQVQTRHGNALANCETTSSVFEPKMIFGSMRNIGSKKRRQNTWKFENIHRFSHSLYAGYFLLLAFTSRVSLWSLSCVHTNWISLPLLSTAARNWSTQTRFSSSYSKK